MKKYAVLAMDLEDWFHLDYFLDQDCDRKQSTIDGFKIYLSILKKYEIKTTFFVVGELIEKIPELIHQIIVHGHEIALHSYNHKRPLTIDLEEFEKDTVLCLKLLEEKFNYSPKGFRAPCFSIDRTRLNKLIDLGLSYDASKINFTNHDLYGNLDLEGFNKIGLDIFCKDNFYEFETTTINFLGRSLPISGGGYLRIFPWIFIKILLKKLFKTDKNYFFYIHPFEFSINYDIKLPENTSLITKLRFNLGRKSVEKKFNKLVDLLKKNNFNFVRFEDLLSLGDEKL
jgi:polysaccharide deacetylase family protein (PEP-CTERM system associated)